MPYVIRDKDNKIVRATATPIHGAEALPYDHPDLIAFLTENGQDQQIVTDSLHELRRTDPEMSRAVEDVIVALLKKNILRMTDLPQPVQERMAYRVKMRMVIQDAYDHASSKHSNAQMMASVKKLPQEPDR
ncbi:MAG: hypothetical protein EOM37_00715 [Proteobacteria bacterium]|jgi:hypothetical protein|nr:hypothetical protein [Alphaproteobacteria bacterium]NCC02562.1 hypothetical protein [Pseudomonadota bacterium]